MSDHERDDGDDGGRDNSGSEGERLFTQAELESIVKKRVERAQRPRGEDRLEKLEQTIEGLAGALLARDEQIAELIAKGAPAAKPESAAPPKPRTLADAVRDAVAGAAQHRRPSGPPESAGAPSGAERSLYQSTRDPLHLRDSDIQRMRRKYGREGANTRITRALEDALRGKKLKP